MRFGIYGVNAGPCAAPEASARVARAAEACGFDSVWTAEHVVLPDPQVPPSPAPPEMPLLDPAVALGFLAAHTERVLLGTGIVILPQRNPLVLAKALASVDVLSGGRLVFGIGAGYLHQEFEALGIPFADRGARTDDYLDAMTAIWSQERPAHRGRFASFASVQARPRPVQQPGPPLVVGGQSPAAYRRAVARGHGWYGFSLDPDATEKCLEGLAKAATEVERPAALGTLEISITPAARLDRALVGRYEDLGVARLIPIPWAADADATERRVREIAEALL